MRSHRVREVHFQRSRASLAWRGIVEGSVLRRSRVRIKVQLIERRTTATGADLRTAKAGLWIAGGSREGIAKGIDISFPAQPAGAAGRPGQRRGLRALLKSLLLGTSELTNALVQRSTTSISAIRVDSNMRRVRRPAENVVLCVSIPAAPAGVAIRGRGARPSKPWESTSSRRGACVMWAREAFYDWDCEGGGGRATARIDLKAQLSTAHSAIPSPFADVGRTTMAIAPSKRVGGRNSIPYR